MQFVACNGQDIASQPVAPRLHEALSHMLNKQTCQRKRTRNGFAKALRVKTTCSPRRISMYRYVIHSAYIKKSRRMRDAYSFYLESRGALQKLNDVQTRKEKEVVSV